MASAQIVFLFSEKGIARGRGRSALTIERLVEIDSKYVHRKLEKLYAANSSSTSTKPKLIFNY